MMTQALSNLSMATRGGLDRFAGRQDFMLGSGLGWIGLISHTLFNLAIIVALIVLIVHFVRSGKRSKLTAASQATADATSSAPSAAQDSSASALVILNERYARGEISEEEFLQMKKNLAE